MDVQHLFETREVEMTDGSGPLWEVITGDGERIASCTNEEAARDLEMSLNMALTDWVEEDESDRQANC